ncbi:MAG TPA: hypothetical protein VMU04_21285 [Candidatus Acidoferrum sp.]|nr:hypothetical protein [Candidatus Acidoferrum sp.]
MIVKHQTTPSSGYYFMLVDGKVSSYQEFADGKLNGLFTDLHTWLRFTNGMAVGTFLVWGKHFQSAPPPNVVSDALMVDAEITKPYDFWKYQQGSLDLTWVDFPSSETVLYPKVEADKAKP